jgi:uncharacterized membrane protein YagU involved in acid resistance
LITRSFALDLAIGLAAGSLATKVTDLVQGPLSHATPEREKAREPEMPEGSSAMTAARKTAGLAGADPDKKELQYLKSAVHYGLGAGWGTLYGPLRRHGGMSAIGAGVAVGTALSLVIDEALNPALNITPPARAYPASSHLRGLLAHLVYGVAVAATAEGLYRVAEHRWNRL